jgi:metallo-beta-lactamase class B
LSVSAALLIAAALLTPEDPAAAQAALAAHCEGEDGWEAPAPPARIHGDAYYVGTCGIAAILIAGPDGHVLIDSGPEGAAPLVAANIAALGYRVEDVRLILNSHEHLDHAGGIAALQDMSGATVAVRAPALGAFVSGETVPGDPQHGSIPAFAAARVGRIVADGEILTLGPLALTAHATPGHTPGGTSWTWRSCEGGACIDIVYADSMTAVSAETFRFSARPSYVAAFRASLDRIGGLPCDLLLTPHPGASGLFARLAEGRLAEEGGCQAYADRAAGRLDARLAGER